MAYTKLEAIVLKICGVASDDFMGNNCLGNTQWIREGIDSKYSVVKYFDSDMWRSIVRRLAGYKGTVALFDCVCMSFDDGHLFFNDHNIEPDTNGHKASNKARKMLVHFSL